MLSESGRGHEAKCRGVQSDCPTEYLGVTCSELRVQRCNAKGSDRTVQLNLLASRETSGAIEAKHVLPYFLTLFRFGNIAYRMDHPAFMLRLTPANATTQTI
jgi:hypothetical protein